MTNEKFLPRQKKIASLVSKYVAEILLENYQDDPILSQIAITNAEASGGLQFVRLFFNTRKTMDLKAVNKVLNVEKAKIRFALAKKMNQKYVPDLAFNYDDSQEKAERLEELLKNL